MRMIVIGTGPIGGIIGGRLARAGHDLTFVDVDKEHIAAIREKGLQVDVPDGAFNVRIKIFAREKSRESSIAASSLCVRTTLPTLWPPRCLISNKTVPWSRCKMALTRPCLRKKSVRIAPSALLFAWDAAKSPRGTYKPPPVATFMLAICTATGRRNSKNSTLCSIR